VERCGVVGSGGMNRNNFVIITSGLVVRFSHLFAFCVFVNVGYWSNPLSWALRDKRWMLLKAVGGSS